VLLPGLLAIAGLIVWLGYELVLRRRGDTDTASWQGGSQDQNSTRLLLAAYAVALAVNVALSLASVGMVRPALRWAGVAVLAVGLALRAWGMTTLGASYTRTLRTAGDQRLVQGGPYRLIRHPGYSGSLLVWAGYSLGWAAGSLWCDCRAVARRLLPADQCGGEHATQHLRRAVCPVPPPH
jgi:protein-S-isoprenylcysteine O-methyltransferase Ste14